MLLIEHRFFTLSTSFIVLCLGSEYINPPESPPGKSRNACLFNIDSLSHNLQGRGLYILTMVSFTILLSALTAISSVLAIPLDTNEVNFDDASVNSTETERIEAMFELMRRQSTPNSSGTHNGYFYSFWSDGASPVTYTNGAGGSYSMQWQSGGNVVAGKGWNPGGPRSISYTGTWSPVNNGNAVSCAPGELYLLNSV